MFTWPLCLYLTLNGLFLLLWLYQACSAPPSPPSLSSTSALPRARPTSKHCTCVTLARQRQNLLRLCLRLVYSLPLERGRHSASDSSSSGAKIVCAFINDQDKKQFKFCLLARWLFETTTHSGSHTLGRIFLSQSDAHYQVYRLSSRTFMLKINFLLDNCLNYFDDLILKSEYSPGRSSRRRRSSKQPKEDGELGEMALFRLNPRKIRKVFIRVVGNSNWGSVSRRSSSRRSSSRRKSSKARSLSGCDPLGGLLLKHYWLELVPKPSNATLARSPPSLLPPMDTFFFASLFQATLTRLGVFYQLNKYTLLPTRNRFPDKYITYRTARMTWRESGVFLYLASNELALVSFLVVDYGAIYFPDGLFLYALAGVVSSLAVGCLHFGLLYVFKGCIQRWMALPPREAFIKRATVMLATLFASLLLVIFSAYFIVSLSDHLQTIWLYAYLLSLGLFSLTGLYIWLLLAAAFQYFDLVAQNDLSGKPKYRKAFREMMDELVFTPAEEQNSLSDDT